MEYGVRRTARRFSAMCISWIYWIRGSCVGHTIASRNRIGNIQVPRYGVIALGAAYYQVPSQQANGIFRLSFFYFSFLFLFSFVSIFSYLTNGQSFIHFSYSPTAFALSVHSFPASISLMAAGLTVST